MRISTRERSEAKRGWYSTRYSLVRAARATGSSPRMIWDSLSMPDFRAFWEDAALPSTGAWQVDFCALRRFASVCLSVAIKKSGLGPARVGGRGGSPDLRLAPGRGEFGTAVSVSRLEVVCDSFLGSGKSSHDAGLWIVDAPIPNRPIPTKHGLKRPTWGWFPQRHDDDAPGTGASAVRGKFPILCRDVTRPKTGPPR